MNFDKIKIDDIITLDQLKQINKAYLDEFINIPDENVNKDKDKTENKIGKNIEINNIVKSESRIFFNFWNYFKTSNKTEITKKQYDSIAFINTDNIIKMLTCDPFYFLSAAILTITVFIYFTNMFICQLFGFFIPMYYGYKIISNKKSIDKNIHQIVSLIKYFFVYSHLECIFNILYVIGFEFCKIKLLIILLLLYLMYFRPTVLSSLYLKITQYDKIFIVLFCFYTSKIVKKYRKIKKNIVDSNQLVS